MSKIEYIKGGIENFSTQFKKRTPKSANQFTHRSVVGKQG